MDRKTIAAIALCVAFLLFYRPLLHWLKLDRYMEQARRPVPTAVDTTRRDTSLAAQADTSGRPTFLPGQAAAPAPRTTELARTPVMPAPPVLEQKVFLETDDYMATFDARGGRLLSVELKRYAASHARVPENLQHVKVRRGEIIPPEMRVMLAGDPLVALDLGSGTSLLSLKELNYTVAESLDAAGQKRAVTFTAHDSSGLAVRQTWRVRPGDYALDLEVEIDAVPASLRGSDYSLTVRSWPLITDADLSADIRQLRATSMVGTNIHREHVGSLLKGPRPFDGNALWAGVQNRYFIGSVAIQSGTSRGVLSAGTRRVLPPEVLELLPPGAKPEQEVAINSLVVGLPAQTTVNRFVVYAGPCEYFRLSALKLNLERAVDLGWSWVLPFSKALLMLLNWLYGVFRNYGVAILVLATLVRLVLHPLNMISMKSMRSMQKLQPEMERIKEKYKNDAPAMNAAIMALYKENKVNPAGGCLPMLLQMPLFLALYQVLFNAIELRQAPFVGWMNDLSAPDHLFSVGPFPIRMMPILMLGSGLLTQRLTPTDPRQMPTMYMMNIFMLVFFYNLPSGLVFYWTVMNFLTALQQWLVLRQDGHPPSSATVVSEPAPKRRKAPPR